MLRILEQILIGYDDLISERLSQTTMYPGKARKGLGRHLRKGDPKGRFQQRIYKPKAYLSGIIAENSSSSERLLIAGRV
jgi:hypothetical protein